MLSVVQPLSSFSSFLCLYASMVRKIRRIGLDRSGGVRREFGRDEITVPTGGDFLVDGLAVQLDVEAVDFLLGIHPKAHHHVDDLEDDVGRNRAVDDGGRDAFDLDQHLAGVAVEQAGLDRKSTRLNSSHVSESRMPSSA